MMGLKKWIRLISDHGLDLQERLFRLLVLIGLCELSIATIIGIAVGEDLTNVIPLVIVLFVFAGIAYFSLRLHKIQLGAVITGALLIYLVLPLIFLTFGGIYGGASVYLLFGMVYVCLIVKGKVKYILLVSGFAVDLACFFIAYFNPVMISRYSPDMAYIDSAVSLLSVGVGFCGMILFQNETFSSENAIVKKQKQEIEELNRAQNRFFSSMSHEIRTPINTIIGLNEMILRADVSDEVAADAMNIQGASKMLLSLINDFLDMSKIESGKMDIVPVTYDVGAMLSDIVNLIWVRAKDKGLTFHIDVDRDVPAQLVGDEVRIKQILINILNNAVKYTQSGSVTLAIQCKGESEDQRDHVLITYSVTDTGVGIKKENIPHLFSAFKRVDEEQNRHIEGTGLGLAIVKQLVDLMGGDIAVNSVYTKGSTFVITLPQQIAGEAKIGKFDLEARRTQEAREHYKQSFEAPKAHVLIVDDNEVNLMVAKGLLRDTKVQVETVTSGGECLKRTLRNRYDVILMDHLMPGMDGIECMHAVRTQTGGLNLKTPVVILTANAGGESQALYRREGFDGYLSKPVDGGQLEAEVLRHLPREIVNMTGVEAFVGVIETPTVTYARKLPVMISTDNVCDLPRNLVEKHQIAVVPFRLFTEDGEFLDGIEAEADGALSYGRKGKDVRALAPNVADYEEFFADQLAKTQHIIHITTAKHASRGYVNALEASKTFDNVTVIDSGHLSSGMGLMVLQAAKYAADEMSVDAIIKEIEAMKTRVRTSFIVGSTEYLARSERISPKINEVCKMLMIHPVIVLKKSRIKVGSVRIGARDHIRRKYIASTLKAGEAIDTGTLFITYAGLKKEELEDIKEQVERKMNFQNIIFQKASSAISTHCGPGTFGLLFMMKSS